MDEFIDQFCKRYERPLLTGLVLMSMGMNIDRFVLFIAGKKIDDGYSFLLFLAGGLLIGYPILMALMSLVLYLVLTFSEFLFGIGKSVYARREQIRFIFFLIGFAIVVFLILSLILLRPHYPPIRR